MTQWYHSLLCLTYADRAIVEKHFFVFWPLVAVTSLHLCPSLLILRWLDSCRATNQWSMLPKEAVLRSQPSPTSAVLSTPFSTYSPAAPTSGRLASASWAGSSRPPTLRAGARPPSPAAIALSCTRCQSNWGNRLRARTGRGAAASTKRWMNLSSRPWPAATS